MNSKAHTPHPTPRIPNSLAAAKQVLDAVQPVLNELQTRLSTVYDGIRAQHD